MNKIPEGPLGFGERLKALRLARGWGTREVAKRLHIHSHSVVYHWETGRNLPGFWSLIELSKLFGVSLDHLVGVNFGVHHDHAHHQTLPTQTGPARLHDGGTADVRRDGECE